MADGVEPRGVNPRVRKADVYDDHAGGAGPVRAKKAKVDATATFAWQKAADETDAFARLDIKEGAFRDGMQCAERVRSLLEPVIAASAGPTRDGDGPGATELINWVARLDEAKKTDSEFRVYIGFAGVTGAGKTSAINSIIGFKNLLPCSIAKAATAVPCLIAYNDDPMPSAAFRAEVTFKTENDIRQELDEYFEVLRLQDELKTPAAEDLDTASAKGRRLQALERLQDLEKVEENAQELQEMVSVIFGLDAEELKGETVDSLLTRYPDVRNLLGQTKQVVCSDAEEFSARIKPYMDSVPDIHGTSGVEFAAWPLIVNVEVFLRSAVLKNGVVLVDLPGLADNVASRALVAQNYFSKLSVTAVVAPVIRSLSEQTAVNLMTENQLLCMQMDGQFHKKSFCVILSKMDDIDVDLYVEEYPAEASRNKALVQCRRELKNVERELKNIEAEEEAHNRALTVSTQQRRKIKAAYAEPTNKATKAAKVAEFAVWKKKRAEELAKGTTIAKRLKLTEQHVKHLEGEILYWSIHGRNAIVDKHIQADFAKRQKRLAIATATEHEDLYDGTLKVFPISSTAFWNVSKARKNKKPVGFPAVEYTGIPALRHWLRYAAIPNREDHLDASLNTLHGLFNVMQAWSSFDMQGELRLTKQFVSDEVLHRPLLHFEKTLATAFNKLSRDIKALDPLKNKDGTLANCKQRCIDVVARWANQDPSNPDCKKKMWWNTYNACVRRDGAPYSSKVKGVRVRIAWIETLCNIFYQGIVNEWNRTIQDEIPALRQPAADTIDATWAKLMMQLSKSAGVAAPQMLPLLDSKSEELNQVKLQLQDMVKEQFKNINMGARKAHRTVNQSVAGKFRPAFTRAKNEKGQGMFLRQQQIINDAAAHRGTNMFKDSTQDVAAHLGAQLKSLPKEFKSITQAIRRELSDLIIMMLNLDDVGKGGDRERTAEGQGPKEKVQQATQEVVAEWAARWLIGIDTSIRTDTAASAIPDSYYEPDENDMDGSESAGMDDDIATEAHYKKSVAKEDRSGLYD